jgi:hypothetical protein
MGREGFCGHVSSIITSSVVEAICQAEAEPAVPVDPLWGIWLAQGPSGVEDGRILQASHYTLLELVNGTPTAYHHSISAIPTCYLKRIEIGSIYVIGAVSEKS